ncbi:MAG: alanine--glyoxylate aminotransferase family protein [Candidatus Omnitrophica bacterium]|nr:alanine--glyoxylate aminotransferase family protein [Candidatus Omnitrophota bacterium]
MSPERNPRRGARKARRSVPSKSRRRFLAKRRARLTGGRRALAARPRPIPPKVEPAPVEKPAPAQRAAPKRQILLCPGPVNTSPHVKSALAGPDMCHREPEFRDLFQTVRAKLIHALGLDQRYTAVLFSGSGTASLEAAILGCAEGAKKILVVNNGVYGSRIAQAAKIHQIPLVEVRSPVTEAPDLSRVAAALKRESQIGTVAMVHHETSTGMLNPVEEVGALARKFRKRFLVDAISSLGAERLDLPKAGVGLCVGSAGKCLHGAPGLSFVLLSQEEAARVSKIKPRSLYLDLATQLKAAENGGEPPFTPAVPLYAALNAALDELAREGLRSRIARYHERAVFLRDGFKKMGLKFLLEERLLSNTLTALWLPEGKSYAQVHDALKRAGYVIYAGQSELKGKILRVAHMGQLLQQELKAFLRALKDVLETGRA